MADIASAFAQGVTSGNALQVNRRKRLAYNALRTTYGDIAGDPEAAASLQRTEQAGQLFPGVLEQQKATLAEGNVQAEQRQAKSDQDKSDARVAATGRALDLLDATADQGGDIGAAFDRIAPILPALGVDPEHAGPLRQLILSNPGKIKDIRAAFEKQQAAQQQQDPVAVREYQFFQGLPPDKKAEYLNVKRSENLGQARVEQGAERLAQGQQRLDLAAPGGQQAIAGAREVGKAEGKRTAEDLPLSETGKVKAAQELEATQQSFDVADKAIADALTDTSWLSAGPLASLGSWNPASEALRGDLLTVQSKVVLDTISEMKKLSATGSTGFGQLSDKEGALIQSRMGAVLQATSPRRLKRALADLQTQLEASRSRIERAYAADLKARGQAPAASGKPSAVDLGDGWTVEQE